MMRSLLIVLSMMVLSLLVGCSSDNSKVERFVMEEQSALTYNEYESFLRKNMSSISEDLTEQFITRLNRKPKSIVTHSDLQFLTIDWAASKGIAVFSIRENTEYKVITFKFDNRGKITEYDIITTFGVK